MVAAAAAAAWKRASLKKLKPKVQIQLRRQSHYEKCAHKFIMATTAKAITAMVAAAVLAVATKVAAIVAAATEATAAPAVAAATVAAAATAAAAAAEAIVAEAAKTIATTAPIAESDKIDMMKCIHMSHSREIHLSTTAESY